MLPVHRVFPHAYAQTAPTNDAGRAPAQTGTGSQAPCERMLAPTLLALGPTLRMRLHALPPYPLGQATENDDRARETLAYLASLDLTQDTLAGLTRHALGPSDQAVVLGQMATFIGGGFLGLQLEHVLWDGLQAQVVAQYQRCDAADWEATEEQPQFGPACFFIKIFAFDGLYRPDICDPKSYLFLHHVLFPIARAFCARGVSGLIDAVQVLGAQRVTGIPSKLESCCTASFCAQFNASVANWHHTEYQAHTAHQRSALRPAPLFIPHPRDGSNNHAMLVPFGGYASANPLTGVTTLAPPPLEPDHVAEWYAPPNTGDLMRAANYLSDVPEPWSHVQRRPSP